MTNALNVDLQTKRAHVHVSELANIINYVMIPVAVALLVLVVTNTTGDVRIWLSLAVFVFGAGSGLVQFLRLESAALQLGVLIAISAAADILIAEGLLTMHNLSDTAAACILAGITCIRPFQLTSNSRAAR